MKKLKLSFLFLCASGFIHGIDLSSGLMGYNSKADMRLVEFVNDIPELIDALSEETEELQESIYYTVEVNGVIINANEAKMVPIYPGLFTISVKSKKRFSEYVDFISSRIKKAFQKTPVLVGTYYGFVCSVAPEIDTIHLAMPVLCGCHSLKKKEPHTLSYKWPLGIQIWLSELITCH